MRRRAFLISSFALCVSTTIAACSGASTAPSAPEVYEVRGTIVSVTGSGDDTRASVAHEAIPAFKDRDGHASSMEAMTMAFGLAPGVAASSLVVGKPYQLTFDVQWNREPTLRITKAQALPEGTTLQLAP